MSGSPEKPALTNMQTEIQTANGPTQQTGNQEPFISILTFLAALEIVAAVIGGVAFVIGLFSKTKEVALIGLIIGVQGLFGYALLSAIAAIVENLIAIRNKLCPPERIELSVAPEPTALMNTDRPPDVGMKNDKS